LRRSHGRDWSAAAVHVKALADAGALLAYLDRTDPWHGACRAAFDEFRLPLATSVAVVTELLDLVGDNPREVDVTWKFIRSNTLTLLPIADGDLEHIDALMRKYHDRPMDFADATLVHLAQRESIFTVFTVDHNDFEAYRVGARRRFRVLPPRT
jgi:predicted nucleic acid-binding protein